MHPDIQAGVCVCVTERDKRQTATEIARAKK
jgi:hypothetical protein